MFCSQAGSPLLLFDEVEGAGGGSARTARPPGGGGGGAAAFVSEFECVHEVKGANQRPRSYSLGVTVQHGPARPRLFERLHNSRVFPH